MLSDRRPTCKYYSMFYHPDAFSRLGVCDLRDECGSFKTSPHQSSLPCLFFRYLGLQTNLLRAIVVFEGSRQVNTVWKPSG
jgi:hypothetical protein